LKAKDIPLIGNHNILNSSFDALLTKIFKIKDEDIKRSVISYKAFSDRLEIIYDKEYTIIDDSKATNPHAAINALRSLSPPLIVIVGGQDRAAKFNDLAYTIRERSKKAVILGETKHEIKNELDKVGFKNYIIVKNMDEAVQEALKKIKKGDTILLSPGCPSWDMYESYKKRGLAFQKEVKKYLK
ncbi:MAG: cyanophycin synthetase, partial [Halanaerobiales bacterium]